MLSVYTAGTQEQAVTKAKSLADKLTKRHGLYVTRVKVEAMVRACKGIPQTDEEMKAFRLIHPHAYFEIHVKVLQAPVPKSPKPDKDWSALDTLVTSAVERHRGSARIAWSV